MLRQAFIVLLLLTPSFLLTAQKGTCQVEGFLNFEEFKKDSASLSFQCQIRKRSSTDIFMAGGIDNFQLNKIYPISMYKQVSEEIYGIRCGEDYYLNAYPFTGEKGYNEILVLGYYTCFTGDPRLMPKEQLEEIRNGGTSWRGIRPIPTSMELGYVLFPNGEIKLLLPEMLPELIYDNDKLLGEAKADNIAYLQLYGTKDFYLLFKYLEKYNASKEE